MSVERVDRHGHDGTPSDTLGSQIESRWAEWGSTGSTSVVPPQRGFWVYVAWGEDRKRPLYVGKARDPLGRLAQHSRIPMPWVEELVELECHAFPNEAMAGAAEIEAIQCLNSIHNRMRRLTKAHRRLLPRLILIQRRAFWADLERRRSERREREARPKPEVIRVPVPPLPEPRKRKRVRIQRWGDELFTPDQLAIIARVQKLGRVA